jgi:DinB superfamily
MKQDLELTIALLERTPKMLDGLLRDLPEAWSYANEGGETWSAFDVVAHLIHAEHSDWIPRAKRILKDGEGRAFDSFDRLGHVRESEGKTLSQLLDEFVRVRLESLNTLRALNLGAREMEKRGLHPTLGTVTLSQLLATWAVHDMTHMHQISRIFAHQYGEAVGPWSAYLGVLQCNGHSGS